MRTADLVGLTGVKPDPDLMEWDYGGYEGMTEAQIRETRPGSRPSPPGTSQSD